MESITLGQVALTITFIVGLIGGITYVYNHIKSGMGNLLQDRFNEIGNKLDSLAEDINTIDMETCKNFLVSILSEVEKGGWLNEIEKERFWEQYEHYEKIGGNGYIKTKAEKIKDDGKL